MTNSMLFRRVGTVISLLLGLALIRFGLNSERFASSPVWGGLIFLVRARWGVLTFLGPTLITIAALTVTRNLLFPVLVTRSSVSRTGIDPWTGWRFPRLFVDLVLVTWLSLLMVVLGIAIIQTVWLHGEERFGSPHDLLFPKGSVADQDHPGTEVSANAKTPAETKPISWTGFHF